MNITLNPLGPETKIDEFTHLAGGQENGGLTKLSNGNLVVVWSDFRAISGVTGPAAPWVGVRIFSPDGTALTGNIVAHNITDLAAQSRAEVVALANGGFMVLWYETNVDQRVMARFFDADGVPAADEFVIADDVGLARMQALPDGGVFVVYNGVGRIFSDTGVAQTAEFQLSPDPVSQAKWPEVAVNQSGQILAGWFEGSDFMVRGFNSAGQATTPVWTLSTSLGSSPNQIELAALKGNQGFVATWLEGPLDDYTSWIQILNRRGKPLSTAIPLSSAQWEDYGAQGNTKPAVQWLTKDTFIVVWAKATGDDQYIHYLDQTLLDSLDLVGQVFNTDGQKIGSEFVVTTITAGNQEAPELALTDNGRLMVTWVDKSGLVDGSDFSEVMIRIFDIDLQFTQGDDTAKLHNRPNSVNALGGNDKITGGNDQDIIKGGAGHDTLIGRGGADKLIGGSGRDILDGGGGNDILLGGDGADTLVGKQGNDKLSGGKGKDTLSGGTGDDVLTGGSQPDVFIFDGLRNEGNDKITDFGTGADKIQISGEQFDDLSITSAGNINQHTLISLDSGTTIFLRNIDITEIDAGDFIFL